jgi:hypothetical protein
MQSLLNYGATVVAVDAKKWFHYESGIFDSCSKDAELGHAVLAVGYAENYWKIQNSWGANWGEDGHIRLAKHQDEDSWCGQDRNPKEGEGCDGGPSEITVCGTCGILYDPIVPEGVRIEEGSSKGGDEESSWQSDSPVITTTYEEFKPWRPQDPVVSLEETTTAAPPVVSVSSEASETKVSSDSTDEQEMNAMLSNGEETTPAAPATLPMSTEAGPHDASFDLMRDGDTKEEQDMKALMR